jgi:uncharacterized protein (UPF0335 family)
MTNFEKSEKIDQIAMALNKFQGAISGVQKNAKGYGYDYTDMSAILSAIQGPMSDNGLSVSQFPVNDENGGLGVLTIVMHISGQYLQSSFFSKIVDKADVGKNCQAHGSLVTYYRRYALLAALNLASTDDDGALAKNTFTASKEPMGKVDNDLLRVKTILFTEIKARGLDEKKACKLMKITNYEVLKKEQRTHEIEGYHCLIKAS